MAGDLGLNAKIKVVLCQFGFLGPAGWAHQKAGNMGAPQLPKQTETDTI